MRGVELTEDEPITKPDDHSSVLLVSLPVWLRYGLNAFPLKGKVEENK